RAVVRVGPQPRVGAVGVALVALHVVAVVAELGVDDALNEAVAAGGRGAQLRALVLVVGVGVVALLHAVLHGPVAAERRRAVGLAGAVVCVGLAVVALLGLLDHAVAAGRGQ